MNCHRCGNEIKDNALRCDACGIKINMICPTCRALNRFGNKVCNSCGSDLLIDCPNCKAINIFGSQTCRKCGYSLISDKEEEIEIVEASPESDSAKDSDEYTIHEDEPVISEEEIPQENADVSDFMAEIDEINEKKEKESSENEIKTKQTDDITIVEEVQSDAISEEVLINPEDAVSRQVSKEEPVKKKKIKNKDANQVISEIKYYSQIQAKQKIISAVRKSRNQHIIAINGEEGSGKSIVLQYVVKELEAYKIIPLIGECTPLTQISNFGFFQDLFIRFLGLPAFTVNVDLFFKNNKKIFESIFTNLEPDEISKFINFLYPTKKSSFENILTNKAEMFDILEKAIASIALKGHVVIISDDFDLMDGSSYEFLTHLIEQNHFNDNMKLLLSYKERRAVQSYFYLNDVSDDIYENIYLTNLPDEQLEDFIANFVNGDLSILPEKLLADIRSNSRGNASYIEQSMALLYDNGCLKSENGEISYQGSVIGDCVIPTTIVEVINKRLSESANLTPILKNALYMAAVMGYKFDVQILASALKLPQEQMNEILKHLTQFLYVIPVNQYTYSFKSLSLWRHVFEEAKNSDLFISNNRYLFEIIKNCILSNNSLKAIVAQNISDTGELFRCWIENSELVAYTGDVNLYVISQKQALKILGENTFENSQILYDEICEKIGKLLYKSNPAEGITYLSNVITSAKKSGNTNQIIDLCGYLIQSCYATGNYYGVIEAVNLVVDLIQNASSRLDVAIVKSRKIKAQLNVGNCEEVINLINNEILPVLEESLSKPNTVNIPLDWVYESWLDTNLTLANAYSAQGNEKGLEVIDNLIELMQLNKLDNKYYNTKALISKALALTVAGKIRESQDVLNDITKVYEEELLDSELLSYLNLIYIINQIKINEFKNLKEELFSLATFANNTNDHFSKNIIKTILGYIIYKDGNLSKSLDIYNEQITYFAKEKIATGALLCWYLIAKITLTTEGTDKALNIATKALEVAQSPKISNYNFIVALQKFIAELYIIKGDLDATKMYLEKSIMIAKKYGMKYSMVELGIAFAKYLEETISVKVVNKGEIAKEVLLTYKNAHKLAEDLGLENLISDVNKAIAAFKTYCQLNSIEAAK